MVSWAVEGLCRVLEAGEFVAAAAACLGARGRYVFSPKLTTRVIAPGRFLPVQRFAWCMELVCYRWHSPSSSHP